MVARPLLFYHTEASSLLLKLLLSTPSWTGGFVKLKLQKESAAQTDWAAVLRKYLNPQVLGRTAVDELIDHIEVGERTDASDKHRQNVTAFYQFADSTQQ